MRLYCGEKEKCTTENHYHFKDSFCLCEHVPGGLKRESDSLELELQVAHRGFPEP
ncbi:hypothetical protein ACRRTK_002094 [Alexandromys fortis]